METKHKTFKPFDKVLVRDNENVWQPDLYGFWDKCRDNHTTMTDTYIPDEDILPYEGNEHLVGTTDEPEEEVKLVEGEWIMVCNFPEQFEAGWNVRQFKLIQEKRIYVTDRYEINYMNYNYAIRFSDFNPNDMKETMKHILCAKNGKVVRYKG